MPRDPLGRDFRQGQDQGRAGLGPRDADAARRFFRRVIATLKVKPTEVVTDAAAAYPAVLDELVEQYAKKPDRR